MAAPDHYAVLGIQRTASEDEIKAASRKVVLEWHPDRNPERTEEAKARFQLIQAAHEGAATALHERFSGLWRTARYCAVLSDADSRKLYDAQAARPPSSDASAAPFAWGQGKPFFSAQTAPGPASWPSPKASTFAGTFASFGDYKSPGTFASFGDYKSPGSFAFGAAAQPSPSPPPPPPPPVAAAAASSFAALAAAFRAEGSFASHRSTAKPPARSFGGGNGTFSFSPKPPPPPTDELGSERYFVAVSLEALFSGTTITLDWRGRRFALTLPPCTLPGHVVRSFGVEFIVCEQMHLRFRRAGEDLEFVATITSAETADGWQSEIETLDGRRLPVRVAGPITKETVHRIAGEGLSPSGSLCIRFQTGMQPAPLRPSQIRP